jgi:hypothetical protein
MPKLTKRTVTAAEPKLKDDSVWDDKLAGRSLQVSAQDEHHPITLYIIAGWN